MTIILHQKPYTSPNGNPDIIQLKTPFPSFSQNPMAVTRNPFKRIYPPATSTTPFASTWTTFRIPNRPSNWSRRREVWRAQSMWPSSFSSWVISVQPSSSWSCPSAPTRPFSWRSSMGRWRSLRRLWVRRIHDVHRDGGVQS